MKTSLALSLLALPLLLTACATPRPPQVFHNTDDSALIVASLDGGTARQILPTPTDKVASAEILAQAKNLSQRQTAVVILENYSEAEVGALFRDRSLGWFIGLRGLGYQRILFLQGNGSANPDGLIALAEYN